MPAKANITFLLENIFEPSFKGGIVSIINVIADQNGTEKSYKTLQEIQAVMTSVFFFYQKHSCLVDAFNEKLGILNAAGIVNFLSRNQVKPSFAKQRQREPKLGTRFSHIFHEGFVINKKVKQTSVRCSVDSLILLQNY